MCQLKFLSAAMSGKVTAISFVLIFCFAECAAGSCLSYGHSCWGAHGKRSGGNVEGVTKERSDPFVDTRWVLSRLVQVPLEGRNWKGQSDGGVKHQLEVPAFSEIQDEQENSSDVQEMPGGNDEMIFIEDPSRSKISEDKMRLLKLMRKNAARLN